MKEKPEDKPKISGIKPVDDFRKYFGDEEAGKIVESEIEGGVKVDDIPVGHFIEVETQNTIYKIERREDGTYISGHPKFCPEPIKVNIHGSTWGGSMIKKGFIGRGMSLEFNIPDRPDLKTIKTSQIVEIKESDHADKS